MAPSMSARGVQSSRKNLENEFLFNPLREVITTFSCAPCGRYDPSGQLGEDGSFRCVRCMSSTVQTRTCAYVSLLYGGTLDLVCAGVVLGQSLQETGTGHDRVLLHTHDLPAQGLELLGKFWKLREVAYVPSANDLHKDSPKVHFKEVFTKLHLFNPEILPYDRVLALDIDMLVLKNIDELFDLRPPAAMCDLSDRVTAVRHGDRMDPLKCSFNAGTMLVAPSRPLFDLLSADVRLPDSQWHKEALSPDQTYLSRVMAGEWSHIDQLFNFQMQLHLGVPVSETWERAEAADIAVAHFSGTHKVWDQLPEVLAPVVFSTDDENVKRSFGHLGTRIQSNSDLRCRILHAHWHFVFSSALRELRNENQTGWADLLSSGDLLTVLKEKPVPLVHATVDDIDTPANFPSGADVVVCDFGVEHLARVVRVQESGNVVVWRTPLPSEASISAGSFGLCFVADPSTCAVYKVGTSTDTKEFGLGVSVIVWMGDGHQRGVVTASHGDDRLVRFAYRRAPQWFALSELRLEHLDPWERLQCVVCRTNQFGAFGSANFWLCTWCQEEEEDH